MAKSYLSTLTNIIFDAPLWVQEVVVMDIKKNLEDKLPGSTSVFSENDIYPLYVPEITFKGKKEIETHDHNLDFNVYRLLDNIAQGMRIADITLNNFWTLEQTSCYLAVCIKNELIKNPPNPIISAAVFYLGNDIRLGEYVKRIDKIDVSNLDDVLRKQKVHNEENPDAKMKIGEVLVHMGYVANNDIDKIINLKEEAKKRFMLSNDLKAQQQAPASAPLPAPAKEEGPDCEELQRKIQKLTAENNLLKEKLRAIFNIQSKKKPNA